MRVGSALLLVVVSACGPGGVLATDGGSDSADGLVLTVRVGTVNDGSGSAGLALLATLRDATGEGASTVWNGEVQDASGKVIASFTYGDGAPKRWSAQWWPAVPVGRGEVYEIKLTDAAGHRHSAGGVVLPFSGLDGPAARLTATAEAIEWDPVLGAASYRCTVDGTIGTLSTSTQCPLGISPAGGHQASVIAFSADLQRLGSTLEVVPALPASFDVATAGFAWQQGPSPVELHALGGAIRFGGTGRGLAVYASLLAPGGAPSSASRCDGPSTSSCRGVHSGGRRRPRFGKVARCPSWIAMNCSTKSTRGGAGWKRTKRSGAVIRVWPSGSPLRRPSSNEAC